MANNLEALVPRILAMAIANLRKNLVFFNLVYRDLDADARRQGTQVDVPMPSPMGMATDVTPSATGYQAPDITPNYVSIPLDKWKQSSFYLTDRDQTLVEQGIVPMQLEEASKALATTVDYDIWSQYVKIANTIGTAGQTPFQDVSPATQRYHQLGLAQDARKVLNANYAPMDNRYMILGVDAEANATGLPQFLKAGDAGTDVTIRNGEIGRKLGFDWFLSQNGPTHTNGTTTGTAITVSGNQTAGSESLVVAGCTAVGVGDVFSIAGDDTQYAILAGSTTATWNICPGLAADVADADAITVYPADGAAVNLAMHRDAIAFVSRPLLDVEGFGSIIEAYTDDATGLTVRLEIGRQHKQTLYQLDLLYGIAPLRPELAVRILG